MKRNQVAKQNTFTEFLLYTTPNGKVKVEIFLRDENIWLTQAKISELFGVGIPAINKHLKNIFESGELEENSVISKMETTAAYAIVGSSPCIAVMNDVYWSDMGLFDPSMGVKEFDRTALMSTFDTFRRSLIITK